MMRIHLVLGLALAFGVCSVASAATRYVDAEASGSNNGTTWENSYTNLSTAISAASSNDQIWVAAGTYIPGTNRSSTFHMKAGVDLYGGFVAGMASLGERDWDINATILSGEINSGSNTDNCYHVITGADGWNGILDGFTVTRGYAWGGGDTDPARDGGGLVIYDSTTRVRSYPAINNCRFVGNSANFLGGAICFRYNDGGDAGPSVSNCIFEGNSTWRSNNNNGGAIYQYHRRPIRILGCTFIGGTAHQGAAVWSEYGDPIISDSVFINNAAVNSGGAIHHDRIDLTGIHATELSRCTFAANQSTSGNAGAVYWARSGATNDTIQDCAFYANSTGNGGYTGGGLYAYKFNGVLRDCVFSGNSAGTTGGGGIRFGYSDTKVSGLVIAGNSALHAGGGIKITGDTGAGAPKPSFTNVLVVGNYAKFGGGGLQVLNASTVSLDSCTFVGNAYWNPNTGNGGGGLELGSGRCNIKNSIIYGNSAPSGGYGNQVFSATGTSNKFSYVDLDGGMAGVYVESGTPTPINSNNGGLLSADPAFGPSETGSWTTGALYTNATGQTVLTDAGASWTTDELAGTFLNPNTNSASLLYYIAENSATTITVLGQVTNGTSGATYSIRDFRLQSKWGRWTALGFVLADTTNSPCIDTGDASSAFGNEPMPNGSRINMGFDGNTAQASKSPPPAVGPRWRFR